MLGPPEDDYDYEMYCPDCGAESGVYGPTAHKPTCPQELQRKAEKKAHEEFVAKYRGRQKCGCYVDSTGIRNPCLTSVCVFITRTDNDWWHPSPAPSAAVKPPSTPSLTKKAAPLEAEVALLRAEVAELRQIVQELRTHTCQTSR